jgi:hypothetical protein
MKPVREYRRVEPKRRRWFERQGFAVVGMSAYADGQKSLLMVRDLGLQAVRK